MLLVCCVAGLLGLLSAATGFGAEATRIKVKEVKLVAGISLVCFDELDLSWPFLIWVRAKIVSLLFMY